MTVRGSPQRHRWVGDVPGQPRLLRRLISTVMAIAPRQDQATTLGAAGVSRRQPGDCNMNATARISPSNSPSPTQYMRALERANEVRLARADLKRKVAMEDIP